MKSKTILFISLIILIIFIYSCKEKTENTQKNISNNNVENFIQIEGLIEISWDKGNKPKKFFIIKNHTSKSRISYEIINLDKDKRNYLIKNENKIIQIKIKIVEKKSPWLYICEMR